MLDLIAGWLHVAPGQVGWMMLAVLAAGLVRGFSGFGLSATVMACLVFVLPPIALIPVCFVLEASASLLMARGGMRTADRTLSAALAGGNLIGVPIGLFVTGVLTVEHSRLVALLLILTLATLQFARGSGAPASAATPAAGLVAGLAAGVAAGLASVGGMVIALFLLGRAMPVATVRGSLVLFLALSMPVSGGWLFAHGMLDGLALQRAATLTPPMLIGVLLGSRLFDPSRQRLYRRACLLLLAALALAGLLRLLL